MLYWKCENEKCKNFEEEILEINPIFKYTENGTVPINIPYCKCCGQQMGYREELPKNEGDINISFMSFNSKSNEDKASVLKKRYKENAKKEGVEDKIRYKREQMTKQFFGE